MTHLEERKHELIDKLQTAMILELSTIPPYLTAALSIKPQTNFEASKLVHSVMMEEMLHMILAGNLLSSLGGSVYFNKDNLPRYPLALEFKGKRFKDREFDVNLVRFSPGAIETFLQIEMPTDWVKQEKALTARPEMEIPGITIGAFYEEIEQSISELCEEYGETKVFTGEAIRQIDENFYWKGGGKPVVVSSLESAREAINVIVSQGEGCSGSIFDDDAPYFQQKEDVAHFFKFNEIKYKQHYGDEDDPALPPTGDTFVVSYSDVFPIIENPTLADYDSDPKMAQLNRQFNKTYSLMLSQIAQAFNGNPHVLYTAITNGMHGLGPIAKQMMSTPILGNDNNEHGAPTFEWIEPMVTTTTRHDGDDEMISLISKWPLKDGCPDELKYQLEHLAEKVKAEEGTLMYIVNLQARAPLDSYEKALKPQPEPIPHEQQVEVVFLEVYRNAQAFSDHVRGEVFNAFRIKTLKYFQPDPMSEGWPITKTEFLTRQSDFIKPGASA